MSPSDLVNRQVSDVTSPTYSRQPSGLVRHPGSVGVMPHGVFEDPGWFGCVRQANPRSLCPGHDRVDKANIVSKAI
jgi:hypothetical protein